MAAVTLDRREFGRVTGQFVADGSAAMGIGRRGGRAAMAFDLGLTGTRREPADNAGGAAEHSLMPGGTGRW